MEITIPNNKNVFATSDFHFFHGLCTKERGFATTEEMDETMIDNTNKTVKSDDVLLYLGDWSYWKVKSPIYLAQQYRNRINCKNIYYIFGNHDKKIRYHPLMREMFLCPSHYLEVYHKGQFIILHHYAYQVYDKCHYGAISLHGHSHNSLPDNPHLKNMDVGIDCSADKIGKPFTPFSFDEIMGIMDKKKFTPVDHHGR